MTRKSTVDPNNDNRIEKRFATWIKMVVDLIAPKYLWLIAGRATSKTTDVIAERFMDVCYDMPGAYFAFVADTYVNALKNIIPALVEGLNRKGWIEDIHYVIDKAPPAHFQKPYKAPQSYKHTISIFNGCFVNIVSMDQPSGAAGNSYQHLFGDEAKYLDFDKIKKLTPALRGYKKFAKSVFYRGSTFTTDMPNIADGEYDWIIDREKDQNEQQNRLALRAGFVINDLRKELISEQRSGNYEKVKKIEKQISRWESRWTKIRKNSTFFKIVSSYVNVDYLTPEYYKDSYVALGPEEFKTAIGSFRPTLKKGEKFYPTLGDHHFVTDGIDTEYYKKFAIGDDVIESCLSQKYLNLKRPLEAGTDFGNMSSLVVGQENGNYMNIFKNFYTLPPEGLRQLANQFLAFFADHECKILDLYYDRSGNQYAQVSKDWATELKGYIETDAKGLTTNWIVNLKNKGQATILQEEEHKLMKNIFAEDNPDLPVVRFCRYGCRELKSSMELAKTIIKIDNKGRKTIHKNKSSEKLPARKLPMFSTNLSDACKYLFYRKVWANASANKKFNKSFGLPENL